MAHLLARALVALGHRVTAVEPIPEMRAQLESAVPGARPLAGTAEFVPLADGSADVVTAAQAPGVPFMVYADAATTPASQASAQALTVPPQSLDSAASTGLAPSPFLRAPETVAPPPMLGATLPLETGGQTPVDVTGATPGPALREIVVRGAHQPTSYERSEPASISETDSMSVTMRSRRRASWLMTLMHRALSCASFSLSSRNVSM